MKEQKSGVNLLLFFVIMVMFNMAASFAHPVTPTLIVERHLDSSMFGIALAAMLTMMFLFAPFWGKMCSYVPTRNLMLIGAIGYSIGQYIFGSAVNEAMVVGGRAFAGVFTSACFTAFANYVINVSDQESRGQNLTILATVQNVAGAVGYFVGGMLGLISVEFTFTCQIIVLALGGIAFFFISKDDTPYKHRPERKLSLADANPFAAFFDLKNFITPALGMLFAITAICAIGQNSFEQVFNYYIKDYFGLSSAYNGIFKAAIAATGFIANSLICMRLIKKTDTNVTFLPVIIACVVPLGLALLFFNSLWPFAVCDIIFFTINTMRLPLMQNLCAGRATPETSNSVMGFYQAMGSLGGIFGAAFAGLIYDTNSHYPFILAFCAFVIGAVLSLMYVRTYRREIAAGK
ncbi:MAG: MFS transporter [Firmicutes bacterium]|nr:MFS transporter [Bacillota bacterium]